MEVVSKKIHTSRNIQLQESQVFQMSSGKSKDGAEPVPSRGAHCSPRARSELLHLSASKQNETRGFLPTTNCSLPASKCTCVCVCMCVRAPQPGLVRLVLLSFPRVTIALELDHLPGAQEGPPRAGWRGCYGHLLQTLPTPAPPPGKRQPLAAFEARPWPREHTLDLKCHPSAPRLPAPPSPLLASHPTRWATSNISPPHGGTDNGLGGLDS